MQNYDYEDQLTKIEDFGHIYNSKETKFKIWAPDCDSLELALYETWDAIRREKHLMKRNDHGVWTLNLKGDLEGEFYNYIVTYENKSYEIVDPYAVTTGINSLKSMIVDREKLNPKWWTEHKIPEPINIEDVILYETHIRDFTAHNTSGIKAKGKYLGMMETESKYDGFSTGIDHLKELGITHVHLLPIADFEEVDELSNNYNWGYNPFLYNVPEGSYVTQPINGYKRVLELKKMIKTYHENGIKVILDVVYNHTYYSKCSNFNRLVPNYYYRTNELGEFSNGSGVGNELATERKMVRKFILDSLKYWLKEYKIDGFRFDLLSLYDKVTVMHICKELKSIKSDIVLYGEPWTGGESALSYNRRFLKGDQKNTNIAVFNDHFRNAVRGDNDEHHNGYVCGNFNQIHGVKEGIVGGINYSDKIKGFTKQPIESINYISCHDDLILADRLSINQRCDKNKKLEKINLLAMGLLLTSYGVPFIHAGTEFMRSKQYVKNSYNLGEDINGVDWSYKEKYNEFYNSVKWLIDFRKKTKLFSISEFKKIKEYLEFESIENHPGILKYKIKTEDKNQFIIIHNCENETYEFDMSDKSMQILFQGKPYSQEIFIEKNTSYKIPELTTLIGRIEN